MDELTEKSDLTLLVGTYLRHLSLPVEKLGNLVKFYLSVRKEATERLTDGTGHKPHYRYVMLIFIVFFNVILTFILLETHSLYRNELANDY